MGVRDWEGGFTFAVIYLRHADLFLLTGWCAHLLVAVSQEQLIRNAGARKATGIEGSGVEGRAGRRRSRSIAAGSGSPRLTAAGSAQQSSNAAAMTGKRKRSHNSAASSHGGGMDASDAHESSDRDVAGAGENDSEERERKVVEEMEASLAAARPALIFCRVVDALQSALKSGHGADSGDIGSGAAASAAAAAATGSEEGTLEVFLYGGDDFLLAAGRAAHEAYESAIKPLGRGGGVVEILEAMDLRNSFARTGGQDILEKGDNKLAAACRERVMNLLCDGELVAASSSRSSA